MTPVLSLSKDGAGDTGNNAEDEGELYRGVSAGDTGQGPGGGLVRRYLGIEVYLK